MRVLVLVICILAAGLPASGQEDDPGLLQLEPELSVGTWYGMGRIFGTTQLSDATLDIDLTVDLFAKRQTVDFEDAIADGQAQRLLDDMFDLVDEWDALRRTLTASNVGDRLTSEEWVAALGLLSRMEVRSSTR